MNNELCTFYILHKIHYANLMHGIHIRFANVLTQDYSIIMKRDQAIAHMKSVEPAIRAFGASALYLFGSTARDEATSSSDVDLSFDRDPSKSLGFDELCGMEDVLEEALGTKVDLVTRTGLHPVLRQEIEQSAIRIF